MKRRLLGGRFVYLTGLLSIILAAGCSSGEVGRGNVSGKVTYKGKPVPSGSITFHWKGGTDSFVGAIKEDGSYSVEKVKEGECLVTIFALPSNAFKAFKIPMQGAKGLSGNPGGGEKKPENKMETIKDYVAIPPRFNDKLKSELKFEVKKGENTFNIDLPEK